MSLTLLPLGRRTWKNFTCLVSSWRRKPLRWRNGSSVTLKRNCRSWRWALRKSWSYFEVIFWFSYGSDRDRSNFNVQICDLQVPGYSLISSKLERLSRFLVKKNVLKKGFRNFLKKLQNCSKKRCDLNRTGFKQNRKWTKTSSRSRFSASRPQSSKLITKCLIWLN